MGLPEAFLCSKLLGNVSESEIFVHTLDSWKPWMQRDESLVSYTTTHFKEIRRTRIPKVLQKLPLVKHDVVQSNPGKSPTFLKRLLHILIQISTPLLKVPDIFRVFNHLFLRDVLNRKFEFNNLVTWSQWHSVHLVGYQIKKRFGKSIKWIAYFGDPWVGNPYLKESKMFKYLNERLQRRVFMSADILIFPTIEMLEFALAVYSSQIKNKGVVISHSFDPSLYPTQRRKEMSGKFVFRYLGQFYGIRSPEIIYDSLLIALGKFPDLAKNIEIEIIGNNSERDTAYEKFLKLPGGLVRFLPQVNYSRSLELMASSDCLISIDAPAATNVFLSAKLIDYLGARRPVIAFTNSGTTQNLVSEYGGWIPKANSSTEGAEAFIEAIKWLDTNRELDFGNSEVRSRFTAKTVAQAFEKLIS